MSCLHFDPDWTADRDSIAVFVLSDLHAYDGRHIGEGNKPSFLDISDPQCGHSDPLSTLQEFIKRSSLRADVLLCPGDLAHKSCTASINFVWNELDKLKTTLGAQFVAATPGNHDLDSHFQNDYDPRGFIQALDSYPYPNESLANIFWSRHIAFIEGKQLRLAILNSSAFHGYRNESDHGRVTNHCIKYLNTCIEDSSIQPSINILLVHHNVCAIASGDAESQVVANAPALIQALSEHLHANWIVVHGHLHLPLLLYAQGATNSPLIFSTASASAVPYPNPVPNQAYRITINTNQTPGDRLKGRIVAYSYAPGIGWDISPQRESIPGYCGFGSNLNISQVKNQMINAAANSRLEYNALISAIPDFPYMLPDERKRLKLLLDDAGYIMHEQESGKVYMEPKA